MLTSLASKLQTSFQEILRAPSLDEGALDSILKDICSALLESDVNVKLVANLRAQVKQRVLPTLTSEGTNKRQVIQRAVFEELVALVDYGEPQSGSSTQAVASTSKGPVAGPSSAANTAGQWRPKKGQSNVIMMVGLQGAGKTTSCTKLASHFVRKGFKSALVCADTFRAGAFDQLKQNATRAKIPFFGSYVETDPVVISAQGVEKFRSERFDVIIVDTSGRHKQEADLFEEMKEIGRAVRPDLTIMVLDGAIGQAAESQSRAFKDAAGFGGIIVTKMDGHARGGGAISAVAATKTPIMFIGTGEHIHDLERFSPRPFISKMLGMGDLQGLMEHVQDVAAFRDPKKQEDMLKKIEKGIFTIRDMREQMSNVLSMGPLSKLANMIPGMGAALGGGGSGDDADMSKNVKKIMYMTDSMTAAELDSDGSMFVDEPSSLPHGTPRSPNRRILRIARGSGTSVREVEEMLAQHRMLGAMVKKMGGLANMAKMQQGGGAAGPGGIGAGRGRGQMPSQSQIQAMQKMLPPQFQGPGGLAQLRQMAQSMGIQPGKMPDPSKMSELASKMGGFGGLGSMFGGGGAS